MTEPTLPTIEVGQVWADCDTRSEGRKIEVLAISDGKALCRIAADATHAMRSRVGRTTRISLDRFRPNSTGYRLVEPEEST